MRMMISRRRRMWRWHRRMTPPLLIMRRTQNIVISYCARRRATLAMRRRRRHACSCYYCCCHCSRRLHPRHISCFRLCAKKSRIYLRKNQDSFVIIIVLLLLDIIILHKQVFPRTYGVPHLLVSHLNTGPHSFLYTARHLNTPWDPTMPWQSTLNPNYSYLDHHSALLV